MEFIFNFIWEKNAREENEDSLCLRHVTKEGKDYFLAVVCDGIGGLPQGENASSFVVDSLRKEMMRISEKKSIFSKRKWRNAFLRKIYQCHQQLKAYGDERGIRLGTTLSMIFLCKDKGFLFHVGDSAVFIGKKGLKKRTKLQRKDGGALRQAVGAGIFPKVEQKRLRVKRGCIILLASDGFYQKCEKEICEKTRIRILSKRDCREEDIALWLRNVYKLSVQKGERDNASAICVVCR